MNKGFYNIFFFAAIMFAGSCKNNDNVFPKVTYGYVNVVNASADTLNYYLNGTRQNNTSSLFPDGQSYYTPPIATGSQNFQFKRAGDFKILFSYPMKLDTLNYSLYVTSADVSGAFSTIDRLYIDTVTNSTQIRFVNASPDAGNLDFYAGDTINYKSAVFKGASAFLATGSGKKEVKIYRTGAGTPLVDTVIAFQPGSIYTLFSKGLLNGKGTAIFDVGLVINH
jgi:hypothetical protein